MIIVSSPLDLVRITNMTVRQLVALRLNQLAVDAAPASPCMLIVVEGGDAALTIEQAAGLPILTDLFDDLPFDHPDFYPCTEILEAHTNGNTCIYEMVFIGDDDGTATAIFVPDEEGIDADLLAMCRSFATPVVSESP